MWNGGYVNTDTSIAIDLSARWVATSKTNGTVVLRVTTKPPKLEPVCTNL